MAMGRNSSPQGPRRQPSVAYLWAFGPCFTPSVAACRAVLNYQEQKSIESQLGVCREKRLPVTWVVVKIMELFLVLSIMVSIGPTEGDHNFDNHTHTPS